MDGSQSTELARLREEMQSLRAQLEDSQETLRAIREGEVDALVVSTPDGERIFTLQGGEHPYRALIEQMREGAATLTPEGVVHYCNGRFAEMLNLPLEAVMGRRVEDFVALADRPAIAAILTAGGGRTELVLNASDATEVPVLVSAISLRAEGPVAICLVVTDLTERKRHEAEIHELNKELEERVIQRTAQLAAARDLLQAAKDSAEQAKAAAEHANRAKDHFLAVLSHELRTPLTPVVMGLSMLQDRPDLDPPLRETLEMVRRNVELEARLIDDLLDVSRIARGKVELTRSTVDLSTVIQRAVEVCQPDIEARGLHFGVDMGAAGPYWVEADISRLQQVFWNLLKNAIKFTPPGGCVGIRVRKDEGGRRKEEGDSSSFILHPSSFVLVEVTDSGLGIEPAALSRIFNTFEQAERSITQQFGGLGLGLAISRALVALHGGQIEAHSEGKGKGATFRVRLPLCAAPGQSEAPAVAAPRRRAVRPLNILLVEDHAVTAKLMRMVLTSDGHTVETAGDVARGVELAGQQAFDLLFSDLGLPDGSGYDLLRQLRERGHAFPAIALSGYGQAEDIQRSREAGFAAHLTKPASRKAVLETLASVAGDE